MTGHWTVEERRDRREAVLREHMESENRLDFDATIATFSHPRYELMADGRRYEGENEVREYFRSSRALTPDMHNENAVFHHSDDAIITEFDLVGTSQGPNGPRGFRCPMVALFFFDHDAGIVCERVYWDTATIRRQVLGEGAS
jgi:hypothetical protein